MGHELLPPASQRVIAAAYKSAKDLYCTEVAARLQKDPDCLKKLGLVRSTVDFSYFDDARERALAEKARIDAYNASRGLVLNL
jgi:hypothetical protein